MTSGLPTGEVRANHDTKRYWDATAEGRLVLPRCDGCGLIVFYPRPICPDCHGMDFTWETMSGNGTVYSYTVTRAGLGRRWKPHLPLVVAYVQLEEGPIMLTNLVDCDPEAIQIGQAVTAVFDPAENDAAVVRFTPTQG